MLQLAEGTCAAEMPKYRCHKEVWALKIREVRLEPFESVPGGAFLDFEDEGALPVRVSHKYLEKHNPAPGGYYVVYEDGYRSFSPAEAFESGYTRI